MGFNGLGWRAEVPVREFHALSSVISVSCWLLEGYLLDSHQGERLPNVYDRLTSIIL